ncbi:MAG: hypothetical protein EU533_06220 [Promethearchaeota archaeon]|nr:MAG: hypothetical protein EU533_06220 [Candidatus Lokiarchaeota archaeon]
MIFFQFISYYRWLLPCKVSHDQSHFFTGSFILSQHSACGNISPRRPLLLQLYGRHMKVSNLLLLIELIGESKHLTIISRRFTIPSGISSLIFSSRFKYFELGLFNPRIG